MMVAELPMLPETATANHFGLVGIQGMTARVQQLGGNVEIKSGSGGTTVHAMVPIA